MKVGLRPIVAVLRGITLPTGRPVRYFVAGLGILMGLSRLADFWPSAAFGFGALGLFGGALLAAGLALALTAPQRLRFIGRSAACLALFCFVFVGAGLWGSLASLLYFYCALACLWEAGARRDDGC